MQIGLSADTIHRRTTMFDRHPDLAAALISTTARRGGYVRPDHLPWQRAEWHCRERPASHVCQERWRWAR